MKAETVFHDIRGGRIFLCIETPDNMRDAARKCYSIEREIDPNNCTQDAIRGLIADMERESGLILAPSQILREELGL